ncbi:UNVERIFIED_CONTAM: hypothetical protein Slati_2704300 [Sesamum latifolium]|uniref:Integrase catalytic domain-containing protein n=1 Tax=Sesamum latifolium TaxID=2727402 RepID=A0AAW2VXT6_9LAMI
MRFVTGIIKYASTKAFFGTKMAEGSSVQSHGVKMLFLVEKLGGLKVGLNNGTYTDVILQSLPPSYDPFIVNYNMNGLEKSIHELINMLVQYEATIHKYEPVVLVGEASTSKAKDKGVRRWKRRRVRKRRSQPLLAPEVLDTGCGAHICNNLQALERSRKLSKDEMVLRLGDGKAVAAEAMGSLSLVGKMTKKPIVGQSATANGLLDLVHTDVCGSLSIPTRGGFLYFITFTDDHSRYGYVYLMRYKFEAFGRFKEYKLEVGNQNNCKIKALRSDRGGEYLNGEFIDYLKENEILSQWTPPGTPQLNRVAERRNRTLLDMVRSMMSFTELSPSFWGYALETAAKLLNIAPSKTVPQMLYEIWHGKPASYKYFRRDETLIKKSSEEPQHDSTTSFEPTIHTDGVPFLRRSTRESRVPERYGFMGLTSQLDNDPKTYGEAISDID